MTVAMENHSTQPNPTHKKRILGHLSTHIKTLNELKITEFNFKNRILGHQTHEPTETLNDGYDGNPPNPIQPNNFTTSPSKTNLDPHQNPK
jgi:hypothetical protein